jgi:hypothetical protein
MNFIMCKFEMINFVTEPSLLPLPGLHQPEILPGTWQNWMYCMYPRSSYMTDFLPASTPY